MDLFLIEYSGMCWLEKSICIRINIKRDSDRVWDGNGDGMGWEWDKTTK